MEFNDYEDISPENDKGVLKKIIKEGLGEAKPVSGSKVFVHYTGTFCGGDKDGEKFDSSKDRNEKFSFVLGEGSVIKAWDIGVATMKKDEICELICKPSYAYGDKPTGSIPSNSTLRFEIELFEWKGKDISPSKDGSVIQTIITQGNGFETPKDCVPVKIYIRGVYEDRVFDEREVEYEIGDGISHNLIPGIEIAVRKMKKGELSKFDFEPHQAFGKLGKKEWSIPDNANVSYEILMKEFEKVKESYSLDTAEEKLQFTENFKTRATNKFQSGNISYATKLYEKAISYVEYDSDFNDEEKVLRNNLLLSLRLNLSLCYIKLMDCSKAIEECDKALELDVNNEKGLYRKGQALIMKAEFEEAKQMFTKVLAINPSNSQAQNQKKICDSKIKEHLNNERKLYKSMFATTNKGDLNNRNNEDVAAL